MKRSALGFLLILAAAQGKCLAQGPVFSSLSPVDLSKDVSLSPTMEQPVLESAGMAYESGPRFWGSADYLLWWIRRGNVPPLVVTGSPTDPFPGALDQPGTRVLFGGNGLDYGTFSGLRLNLGGWLDQADRFGIEAGGFALEHRTIRFAAQADANGQPFLASPFIDALSGNQNVYFISQNFADPALTALLTGGVGVFSSTSLWSWEISGVANVARDNGWTIDLLAGFRQTSLRENLTYVTTASNIAPGGAALFQLIPLDPGFTETTFDGFATRNTFNGGQIGTRIDRRWGPFTLDLAGKLAMGSMHEVVNIQGQTTTNAPLPVTQAVGGIYAQASNIGTFSRDAFAVIPEVDVNLCFQIRRNIALRVGYTFLYMSNVVRPGDQIDPRINVNRVPIDPAFGTPGGPNRPAFDMRTTGFWAQGINFGLEFKF
jgi:hypothetical protein